MRWARPGVVVLIVTVAGAIVAAVTLSGGAGPAHSLTVPPLQVQEGYDAAGNPSLVATDSNGAADPTWRVCSPAKPTTCTPIRSHEYFGNSGTSVVDPGPTPAGTEFEAVALTAHGRHVGRTGLWSGALRLVSRPWLSGADRAGKAAIPHPGQWAGGWAQPPSYSVAAATERGAANVDLVNVIACRDRHARRCLDISSPFSRPPAINGWFVGWYLFAVDLRATPDTPDAADPMAYDGVIYDKPVPREGGPVGRSLAIGPVVGPRPPVVTIFHRALVRHAEVVVGQIRCSQTCGVILGISHRLTSRTIMGSSPLEVPRRFVRPGPLHVVVSVDAGPEATGRSWLQ